MITNSNQEPTIDVDKLPKVTVRLSNMTKEPMKAIRAHCLDCSGGNSASVQWCPCDGVHSTFCSLWPFRFGQRPRAARRRHGEQLLDPFQMPSADVDLEELTRRDPDSPPQNGSNPEVV